VKGGIRIRIKVMRNRNTAARYISVSVETFSFCNRKVVNIATIYRHFYIIIFDVENIFSSNITEGTVFFSPIANAHIRYDISHDIVKKCWIHHSYCKVLDLVTDLVSPEQIAHVDPDPDPEGKHQTNIEPF
jgi:hypothetical protein